jgi:hypothetical protein
MENNIKTIIGAIVGVIVIGGGAWWLLGSQATSSPSAQQTKSAAPIAQTQPSNQPVGSNAVVAANSDEDINANLSAMDSQINAFVTDNASVSSSFNDQPVAQQPL